MEQYVIDPESFLNSDLKVHSFRFNASNGEVIKVRPYSWDMVNKLYEAFGKPSSPEVPHRFSFFRSPSVIDSENKACAHIGRAFHECNEGIRLPFAGYDESGKIAVIGSITDINQAKLVNNLIKYGVLTDAANLGSFGNVGTVGWIVVREDLEGKGVATNFCRALGEWAKPHFTLLAADVADSNKRSRQLSELLGVERLGEGVVMHSANGENTMGFYVKHLRSAA